MKRFCLFGLCLFCLWSLPVYPQSDASVNDGVFQFPLGDARLPQFNAVCGDLAKHHVIKGSFEQTKTISRLNRSLASHGNFIIAADTGMVWDTLSPFPSTMAVGRDYIIQSVPAREEPRSAAPAAGSGARTRLDAAGNETFLHLADTISAIFTGNSQKLLDNFDVYFTFAGGTWVLGLIPREKSVRSFAAKITMSGDQAGNSPAVIRNIYIYEQNGDSIRYTLSNHSFFENLSPAEKALF